MIQGKEQKKQSLGATFDLRKLTKSGSSRYLNVGSILPKDWIAVKVYTQGIQGDICDLRLVRIK